MRTTKGRTVASGNGTNGGGTLLLGTTKGAFLARPRDGGGEGDGGWELDGPHFPGEEVYAMAYDDRGGRSRLWAAPHSPFWGTTLRFSDDFGASWSGKAERSVRFPEDSGLSLKRVWQIQPGSAREPDVIRLGVEPACLFISHDAGEEWEAVEGLLNHPHRERWVGGAGGLCLHTIVTDGEPGGRATIAISAAGAYRSDDGGATWAARNKGVRAEFLPDKHPEFGQCVHKIVHHPSNPGRLFLQNHWGLYRSDDWGDSWTDIANGVPSDFGFAMAMHPGDADTVYIVPLESDGFRCTPEAKLRVYRTRDGGASWEALTEGLPQRNAYETVLRDALDTLAPGQVFFGTRSGKVYASGDDGTTWGLVCEGLPPVVCVKACAAGRG
ncbi:WD40/YVTN/BNR-like repeat-containing protein [Candidatus Palauibacter irciniicola]|uniref:WD40/YVTN/BNR-like repeat-containing protein n=1 Tax=Candidatus Palauibacter irciniicola TaxID=3056733 RepID=UPI003B023C40